MMQRYAVYIGFLAVFSFFSAFLYDDGFLSTRNVLNMILQTAPATVMAIGLVFVLSAGEIDLSFGSVVATAALAAAVTMHHFPPAAGIAVGLGCGVLIGMTNGFFVAVLGLPSFLVTLATMVLFAGIARVITNLQSIAVTSDFFTGFFGSGRLFGIPSLVLWTIVMVTLGHVVLRYTRFGAHVLATGDQSKAAARAGVPVPVIRFAVLTLCGGCAGLAGLLYAGRLQAAKYTLGESDLMPVIAAVIIGGTALFGGRGTIIGALVGSLLMGMLNNGLILMGLSVSGQMIVQGMIILLAITISLRDPNR
ncbi:MAG: ABC transporter permease [Pseudomonadota bacterium]